ncbi:bacillithiol biosynthesis deacetylase BshB1 [Chryseotalea sanaruensis]|uniref:Bacillithiol biosynthesis deacetylase BshB1 n=1 Tax=Chryseotalea sanaruensis TaxID=2482724 RepID=A0A401UDZ4_9BACT|nr:bacillithiol biosynthesis deacetylase BshB1 [Chryseotalea sanaruensis]GCC53128.1 bacillithiol biosynthesis deacetylase BshB1 [Chryseotalea sanaruensis]
MKLDILVIAAHPDDAELGCGGTIAKHTKSGLSVGILDLTRGELGTRGTAQTREQEAKDASAILGIQVRENLSLADGFFQNDKVSQLAVVQKIRQYQPDIILANAIRDRHPDHGKGADLAADACFLAGLAKIETKDAAGNLQKAWRPKNVYHYIQSQYIQPDFIIDVTEVWDTKMASIKAYKTQFFSSDSTEPQTFISRPEFINFLEGRASELGNIAGIKYAEGFTTQRYPVVNKLTDLY